MNIAQMKSQTYQFRNWLGCTRTIYLTVVPSNDRPDIYDVKVHTANLDGTSNLDGTAVHTRLYSRLHPDEDTTLQQCWQNCLEDFDRYFGGKNA
jgi:hypothetical protein